MPDQKINILVIGGGGREHALCWKIVQSPLLDKLYCDSDNAGIATIATIASLNAENHSEVIAFCQNHHITLVVIGTETPLISGLCDSLETANILSFGPSAKAAQLEGSKGFTKDICTDYHIPTAAYKRFKDASMAHHHLETHSAPIVIKADGLAAGKGVIIAETNQQAHDAVDLIFSGQFGEAGTELIIEEFITGEEASFFVLCDGTHILPLATAQDHKRVGDGDIGLNTGGMGAYSPAPIMTETLIDKTINRIILPTLQAMRDKNMPYKGVLYAGLMITNGDPKLIEYNVRFGDPECQVLMYRLKSDIIPALLATAKGDIRHINLAWHNETTLTVIMATKGYPEHYDKGSEIKNLPSDSIDNDTMIFHAGTRKKQGKILAMGGRVLNITARGNSVQETQKKAYHTINLIDWSEGFYRKDIGWRAIARKKNAF